MGIQSLNDYEVDLEPNMIQSEEEMYVPNIETKIEKKLTKDIKNSTKKIQSGVLSLANEIGDITETQKFVKECMKATLSGENKTERNISHNKGEDMISGTHSVEPSENFPMEKPASLNCIESSAKHLNELMLKISEGEINAENVNAAVNCAKGIQGLVRLQMDVIKTFRTK